jgi:ribonuclease Y
MTISYIVFTLIGLLVGVVAGYFLRVLITINKKDSIEIEVKQKILDANEKAQKIIDQTQEKLEKKQKELEQEEKERFLKLEKSEERLLKKEDLLDNRQLDLDKKSEEIQKKIEQIKEIKEEILQKRDDADKKIQEIAKLSEEEAKQKVLSLVEEKYENDLLVRMQKLENTAQEKLEQKARNIVSSVIQRVSNEGNTELMTSTVSIPSEEVKGKVIGKEGRNIRAFERETGVELLVDDTPGTIVVSSFDPIRRQVARIALENLIMDGRIQPAKIEEMVEKARNDINKIIKQKGEEAAYEVGVFNLDPRILAILGRLHFRTSYGQNVLAHSIEMAHIAGMLAEQIGADSYVAKAGALVHDIGKALTHEVQGTHVEIGMRILQKFGADERIITAMKSHHDEFPYESVEAVLVQSADAISGSRPGARSDTVENYIRRLKELETLVTNFEGVEKAYAISAGREVRVFVNPHSLTDIQAKNLSREIAQKIEKELQYPGEIKIVTVRENRIIHYAR